MRRLIPYLFLLFIIAFMDRVNVGYAALEMTQDLGFTARIYGFGAGIFFLGYFLFEIPGTILVEVWSARAMVARIMISWGVLAILMGFIHTASQFYWIRFLLGAAEAGFFPGIIVYLSHWFPAEDRAKAVALFMAAIPVSNILGSPISGLLLGLNWLGIAGWRWLFIVEGVPAIVFGIITIFYLTDRPHQAGWLSAEEREWIAGEIERERQIKLAAHSERRWKALREREVILLTLAYFFIVTAANGLYFWLPTIIKRLSGLSDLRVTLIAALPYSVGLIAMLLAGWSSDRSGERRRHTAIAMIVGGAGLLLTAYAQSNINWAIAMLCVAAIGIFSYLPGFWALPTNFLAGPVAAAAIGLINSVGNLGGFAGPYVVGYLNSSTNSFFWGMFYLSASAFAGAILVITLRDKRQINEKIS